MKPYDALNFIGFHRTASADLSPSSHGFLVLQDGVPFTVGLWGQLAEHTGKNDRRTGPSKDMPS